MSGVNTMERDHLATYKLSSSNLFSSLLYSLLLTWPFLPLQPAAKAQAQALEDTATCRAPLDLSSLSGVWHATDSRVSRGVNAGNQSSSLTLLVDAKGYVKGERNWKSSRYGFNAAGKKVFLDAEKVIGLFDRATCRMVLVETVEAGTIQADLKPDGSLSFVLSQAGNDPVVVMGVYRR
jgi:hypothetical protein